MPKHICFLDDSAEYDGFSPTSRPLDGPQKSVAYLAASLAQRGHQVTVITRAEHVLVCDGVSYPGWHGDRPEQCDLLVVVGDPTLFDLVKNAGTRVLWVAGASSALDTPVWQGTWQRLTPHLVFRTDAQRDLATLHGLPAHVIGDAPAPSYVEEIVDAPSAPPYAVTVCHPLGGLEAILDLWTTKVHPAAMDAELHVYSSLLDRAALSGLVPADIAAIHDKVQAAAGFGVRVKRPQPDPQMAEIYRRARAFLHPSNAFEALALQLVEAQAAGLPAVTFASSPVARVFVVDGTTGFVAEDAAAYAAATLRLLAGEEPFGAMATAARHLRRGRSWAIAAAEWEERFA
ncbi:MAG: glycosyltransferase [Telmatospirillum sp.]|nr:glycosyltransferase [Telmatospirillum sp.]